MAKDNSSNSSNTSGNVFGIEPSKIKKTFENINKNTDYSKNISENTEDLFNNSKKLYTNSLLDTKQDGIFYKSQTKWNQEIKSILKNLNNTIIASSDKQESEINKSLNNFKKQFENENKKDIAANDKIIKELEKIGIQIKESDDKNKKQQNEQYKRTQNIQDSFEDFANETHSHNRITDKIQKQMYQEMQSQNALLGRAVRDMQKRRLLQDTWSEKIFTSVIAIKREVTDLFSDFKGAFKGFGNIALLATEKTIGKLLEYVKSIGDDILKGIHDELRTLIERSGEVAKQNQMNIKVSEQMAAIDNQFFSKMFEKYGAAVATHAKQSSGDLWTNFSSKRMATASGRMMTQEQREQYHRAVMLGDVTALKKSGVLKNDADADRLAKSISEITSKISFATKIANEQNMPQSLNMLSQMIKQTQGDPYVLEQHKTEILNEVDRIIRMSQLDQNTRDYFDQHRVSRDEIYQEIKNNPLYAGMSESEAFELVQNRQIRKAQVGGNLTGNALSIFEKFVSSSENVLKSRLPGVVMNQDYLNILKTFGGDELVNALKKGDMTRFMSLIANNPLANDLSQIAPILNEISGMSLGEGEWVAGLAEMRDQMPTIGKNIKAFQTLSTEEAMRNIQDTATLKERLDASDQNIKALVAGYAERYIDFQNKNKGLDEKTLHDEFIKTLTDSEQEIIRAGFKTKEGKADTERFFKRVQWGAADKTLAEIGEETPTTLSGSFDMLFRLASKAAQNPNDWGPVLEKVSKAIGPMFSIFGDILVKDVFPALHDPLVNAISGGIQAAADAGLSFFKNFPILANEIIKTAKSAWKGIMEGLSTIPEESLKAWDDFKNNIKDVLIDPLKSFWADSVYPILEKFWNKYLGPTLLDIRDQIIMDIPLIGGDAKERHQNREALLTISKNIVSSGIPKSELYEMLTLKPGEHNPSELPSANWSKDQKDLYYELLKIRAQLGFYMYGQRWYEKQENKDVLNNMIFNQYPSEAASGGLFKKTEGGQIIRIAEGDGDEIVLPLSRTQRDNALNLLQIAKDKYNLPIEILGDKNKGVDKNRENLKSYINNQLNYVTDLEAIKAYKEAKQILKNSIITYGQSNDDYSPTNSSPSSSEVWDENNPSITKQHTIGDLMLAYAKLQLGRPYWIRAFDTPMKNGGIYKDGFVCNELVQYAARAAGLKGGTDFPVKGAKGMYSDALTNKSNVSPGKGVIAWGNGNGHIGIMVSPTHWINASGGAEKYTAEEFANTVNPKSCGVLINKIPADAKFGTWSKLNEIATTENYKQFFKATSHNVNEKDFDISDVKHFDKWPKNRNKEVQETYHTNYQIPYLDNNLKPLYAIDTKNYPQTADEQMSGSPNLETLPDLAAAENQEYVTQSFSKIQESYEKIKSIIDPSNPKNKLSKTKETYQVIKEISAQLGTLTTFAYNIVKQQNSGHQSRVVNHASGFGTNNQYMSTEVYS